MKNSSLKFWEFLEEQVHNFVPTALLIVVESEGSSPGRVGFKMAVNDKKKCQAVLAEASWKSKL
ncbi:MAG: XdhC family protein [Saprospiraceae bacterium]|nr:XdhC family protein [Candidatus Brachybacter algidus]